MIWLLLSTYAVTCAVVVGVGNRLGNWLFAVAAIPPLLTAIWGFSQVGAEQPATAELEWVPGLGLNFSFALSPLAALMTVLVGGVGVAVFAYSAGYFEPGEAHMPRFAATLLIFAGAMVGLVWSDSAWTLFVFWELTSITSFLLVGHKTADGIARAAARRALLITGSGGLALLGGFAVLQQATGTTQFSEMTSVTGTSAVVAAVLVMVGAATKSAQVPFHVWLPGAMSAPTPVSAYLHSATMVKAGVLLVAIGAPIFAGSATWKVLGLAFGGASIIWGAIGALRQSDAKLILAWGTVSQLGLMITLLAVGTGKAAFAAMSILLAHAIFKAALFMVVGEVDKRTGTRDIRELSGLWRSMPTAFVVATAAAASMVGIPPLLGFPAKEAAVEAALGLEGAEAWLVGSTIILGSVLTAAYTVRLLLGMFATSGEPTAVGPPRPAMTAPAAVLSFLSLAGFFAAPWVTELVSPAAAQVNPSASVYELLRWPGLTEALLTSVGIVLVGSILGWVLHRTALATPAARGAEFADAAVESVIGGSRRLTSRVQHGSLPVYLLTMATVAVLAAIPFGFSLDRSAIYRWDSGVQLILAALTLIAAVASASVDSRLGAALALGAVGLSVSGLFLAQGAPDLALTQLLVETVIVVGFVLALGGLARSFPRSGQIWRGARIGISIAVGGAVALALASTAGSGNAEPPLAELTEGAVQTGGGNNVVNVLLTDVRAMDTLGEIVVLAVVGIGIVALTRARKPLESPTSDIETPVGGSR